MDDSSLQGVGVLVTRPRKQAGGLIDAITALGGSVTAFPVLEPRARPAAAVLDEAAQLHTPDIVVFISPNAVRHGIRFAGAARIAAVGPATGQAVAAAGRTTDIQAPGGFNSEQLLATPQMQDVEGKIVRIIRGVGGRGLLGDTLRERGATVEYLEVYSRELPRYEAGELAAIADEFETGAIDVVTAMSVATFNNLVTLLPEHCHQRLAQTRLVTPTSRVIKAARDRFPDMPTMLAGGPQAHDIVAAVVACMNQPDD